MEAEGEGTDGDEVKVIGKKGEESKREVGEGVDRMGRGSGEEVSQLGGALGSKRTVVPGRRVVGKESRCSTKLT